MSYNFPTFRDLIRQVSPGWLQIGTGEKVSYAIGVQVDAFGEALVAGLKSRFPNVYSSETLPLIGRERRIRRGLTESSASYATRLLRWLGDHRRRGGPHALLAQMREYLLPVTFPIHLIYQSGARYIMDESGNVTRDLLSAPAVPVARWARWWLLMYTEDLAEVTADDLASVPREWIAAHCQGELLVMGPDSELWDYPPTNTWDEAGTWDTGDALRVPIA